MPNWTNNSLTFIVPSDRKDDFLRAIEGPNDWAFPLEAFHQFERPKVDISNHARVELSKTGEAQATAIAEFKSYMADYGWPEWMKPSRTDIEVFVVNKEELGGKIVPFSVAKIAPWEGPEEFASFFPDQDEAGPYWIPMPRPDGSDSPIINLRNKKIGPKWPPSRIEISVEDEGAKTRIVVTFDTPWSPMDDMEGLLGDLCRDYQAKFLLIWVEEQGLCGFDYFDPASGEEARSEDFGFDNQWNKEVQDEDDPEDTWMEFDHADFEDNVYGMINDADFLN